MTTDDYMVKATATAAGAWTLQLWEGNVASGYCFGVPVQGYADSEEDAVKVAQHMLSTVRKAKANSSRQSFEVR